VILFSRQELTGVQSVMDERTVRAGFYVLLFRIALASCMAQSTPDANADVHTGIAGLVTMSPAHGGPVRQGEDDSAPAREKLFVISSGEKVVRSFSTDEQGRFRVALSPGRYSVWARDGRVGMGACGPFEIEVISGHVRHFKWECESGLR
jgi:hypothetical protein